MDTALEILRTTEYNMFLFLGINRNVRRGWCTLPRTFGGMGLYSFPIEQMICWMNMLVQHFGVLLVLGHKFRALLETLQLELGTNGNLLLLRYEVYGSLATPCR